MSRAGGIVAGLIALLWGVLPAHAQVVLLEPGVNQLQMQGQSFTVQPAIDIPDGTRHLRLEALSSNGADVDLLLRYGEAFPQTSNAGTFGGIPWLYEHAHYRSSSGGPSENLVVTPYQAQPLRPGRWYLALVNFHNQPTVVDITVTLSSVDPEPAAITVDFNDAAGCAAQVGEDQNGSIDPWFDSQTVAPVDGNNGTTIGEQRRIAFNHALERIRQQASPIAPIHIRACWAELGGDANRATLASAGPYLTRSDNVFADHNNPGHYRNRFGHYATVAKAYTWHAMAAIAQSTGTGSCRFLTGASCTLPRADVFIQFNSDLGSTDIIGGRNFRYGLQPLASSSSLDFVGTAMHEIVHGLGFLSLLNLDDSGDEPLGAKFRARLSSSSLEAFGHDDAYSDSLALVEGADSVRPINPLPLPERAAALTAGPRLRWSDAEAAASPANPWQSAPFPDNLPRIYAPDPIERGSNLSHLANDRQLMAAFGNNARDLGLAAPMLSAVGWNSGRKVMPVPVHPMPYGGQWFDPSHNGHGIDLQRVVGTPDTYFLVLYTYDSSGQPEWYTSTGRIVDGVFRPGNNARQNSLWRWRGPGNIDLTAGGQMRIDFNQANRAPECQDGGARAGLLALMDFSIASANGREQHRWCLTQLLPHELRPDFDTTGTWYAGEADSGWGISTLALPGTISVGLNAIVYHFDDDNQPRWALGETANFQSGQPFALNRYAGYCRGCEPPPGGVIRQETGQITINLGPPQGSSGTVSLSFMGFGTPFPGVVQTSFQRTNSPMILLGESAPPDD